MCNIHYAILYMLYKTAICVGVLQYHFFSRNQQRKEVIVVKLTYKNDDKPNIDINIILLIIYTLLSIINKMIK